MRLSLKHAVHPVMNYSFDRKIADQQVKLCGNLQKDIFANFVFLTKDIFYRLPKGFVIYLQGSCIYLHGIHHYLALNYMWCNLDQVDQSTGEVYFHGGAMSNSPSENNACQIFEHAIKELIVQMIRYYEHHQLIL